MTVIFACLITALICLGGPWLWRRRRLVHNGTLVMSLPDEDGRRVFRLELESDPADFQNKDTIVFKIVSEVSL